MKLTKEQIEAAGKWLRLDRTGDACCNKDRDVPHYDNSGCDFMACEDCPPRVGCLAALDAYQRVEALLARLEEPSGLATAIECRRWVKDEQRRALYGEE